MKSPASNLLIACLLLTCGGVMGVTAQTAGTVPPPITNDTPAQTTKPETTPGTGSTPLPYSAPMSKSELKAQKKQQTVEEKAANANAKAAKSQARAKKQTDKATRAEEKVTQPR